ncbi:MAG: FecR family protein [Cyclobacteriaceae bacterium]
MKITKELLERHSLGLTNKEENEAVEEWFNKLDDPSIGKKAPIETEENKRQIWTKLEQAVPELESHSGRSDPKVIPLYKRVTRYVAAAIILCMVGFSTYYFSISGWNTNEPQIADLYQTVQTQRGEKRTLTLSDGSTIRMNYETEVRAPKQFEGDERIVYLEGHAHFDVKKNPDKPFIIYTEDTKTRVLGTSFDINSKGADETEIIVTSGKVAFSKKEQEANSVTLTVNERAVLKSDNTIATSEVDALKRTAWKDNRLVFEGQTLREIIEVLEPWYAIQVTVQNPALLEEDFILSLDNPPLKSVLEDLSFAGGFEYSIQGTEVIIF